MSTDSDRSGDINKFASSNETGSSMMRDVGLAAIFLGVVLVAVVFFFVVGANSGGAKFGLKRQLDPKTLKSIPGLTDKEVYETLEEAGFKTEHDEPREKVICTFERYKVEVFGKNVKAVRLTVVPEGDLGFLPEDREIAALVGQLIYEDESMARITRGFARSRCSSTDTYDDGVTLMESNAIDAKRVLTYRATGQDGELPAD